VNLNDTETRFRRPGGPRRQKQNGCAEYRQSERSRHRIVISERQRARRNDILPTAITFGNRSVACPRRVGAALATGMRQLHASNAALLVNKPHHPRQRLNVLVHARFPNLRTNSALGKNGRRFGKHQSSAAYRPAAQCTKCQSFAYPSVLEYSHIGETNTRFANLNIPNRKRIKTGESFGVCRLSHRCLMRQARLFVLNLEFSVYRVAGRSARHQTQRLVAEHFGENHGGQQAQARKFGIGNCPHRVLAETYSDGRQTKQYRSAYWMRSLRQDSTLLIRRTFIQMGAGKSRRRVRDDHRKWLKRSGKRQQVIIATKVASEMGPGKKGLSKAYILAAVEDSLQRLQTDYTRFISVACG